MFNAEIPNELLLVAAEAIAHSSCGKMTFSMLDTCEWQVLIELDPTVGEMAQDVYFIVRSRPKMPLLSLVTNSYAYDPDALEKPFVSLEDSVNDAIAHFKELEAEAA
ncbi:MAG: hypothetical protein KME13_23410 [Myxacorys californica WJT36-NPBG1]|jgi:hypothetical protein|nr:hypothetical protein [Myxacorys californica WJT36-NPBG1]